MWTCNNKKAIFRGVSLRTSVLAAGVFCCLATVGARADDVDLSLKDIPQPAEIVPAPAYTADVDATQPQGSKTGLGFTDAVARQVECDITTGGSTTSDYVALILDRDATDNLFIKIQQQSGGGTFDHIGFYTGNNVGRSKIY